MVTVVDVTVVDVVVDDGTVVVEPGTMVAGVVVTGTVGAWVVDGASGCPAMVVVDVGNPISGRVVLGVSVTTVVVVVESSEIGPGSFGNSAVVTGERRVTVVEVVLAVVSGAEVVAVVVDAIGPRGWPTVSTTSDVDVEVEESAMLFASTSTSGATGWETWAAMKSPAMTMMVPRPPVNMGKTRRRGDSVGVVSRF
ncbi:MAG: hypothetical protein KJO36_05565 [Acidimicrobiia bacterium]|nr:hypothetical protein [Acidimicrobiia bacterium]